MRVRDDVVSRLRNHVLRKHVPQRLFRNTVRRPRPQAPHPRRAATVTPRRHRYHIVKTDKKILDHQTGDIKKRLLFEPIPGWWNVFRHALPEMVLLMAQIPPGIKTYAFRLLHH